MARYYDIQLYQPGVTPGSSTPYREWTSYPKLGTGPQNDPGALDVMIDAYVYDASAPLPQTVVQIRGVSITDISQSANFTNCTILVFAGFQAGLPLNNAAQAGLIFQGFIFQSYGNWQGTEMTLDFVVYTQGSTASQRSNISFSWLAGTPLASAIATTLTTAFPKIKQNIQISPNLIIAHDEHGVYQSLPPFAQTLKSLSKGAIGGTYPGVSVVWTPTQINVFDGTTTQTPSQLAFQDIIGQPVWIGQYIIQFMCPMRADLSVGSMITMPKGILGNPSNPAGAPGAVVTTSASQPQARQQMVFNGSFAIQSVHHMGIFRQPDGEAWVTVFDAYLQNVPTQPSVDSLSVAP